LLGRRLLRCHVMRGFDLGLSIVAALLVVISTNLVQILPSPPSAVGVFSATVIVALRRYGVSNSDALSFALALHALNLIPYLIASAIVLQEMLRLSATRDAPTPVSADSPTNELTKL
jgi:uncharacterized membrane protein YbhN (UPF0104 family)